MKTEHKNSGNNPQSTDVLRYSVFEKIIAVIAGSTLSTAFFALPHLLLWKLGLLPITLLVPSCIGWFASETKEGIIWSLSDD